MKQKKNVANVEKLPVAKDNGKSSRVRIAVPSATSEASTVLSVRLGEIAFPKGVETLGEKANWLHRCSVELAKRSTGAAILAGWILSVARSTCAHGQWHDWIEKNVSFSHRTVDNYMSLYAQTLGAARAAARRPVALNVEPTAAELEAAAHDVDGKALSALYKSTRLIAASGGWGGKREGAGRKSEGTLNDDEVAAKLDEAARAEPLIWASAKAALDQLVKLDSERDFLHRLCDDHLAAVSSILADISTRAAATLANRISGGGNAAARSTPTPERK